MVNFGSSRWHGWTQRGLKCRNLLTLKHSDILGIFALPGVWASILSDVAWHIVRHGALPPRTPLFAIVRHGSQMGPGPLGEDPGISRPVEMHSSRRETPSSALMAANGRPRIRNVLLTRLLVRIFSGRYAHSAAPGLCIVHQIILRRGGAAALSGRGCDC